MKYCKNRAHLKKKFDVLPKKNVPEVLNVHVNESKKNLLFLEGFFLKQ